MKSAPGRDLTRGRARRTRSSRRPGTGSLSLCHDKERTILPRTTSFSVEAGEAAVGARPATAALDESRLRCRMSVALLPVVRSERHGRRGQRDCIRAIGTLSHPPYLNMVVGSTVDRRITRPPWRRRLAVLMQLGGGVLTSRSPERGGMGGRALVPAGPLLVTSSSGSVIAARARHGPTALRRASRRRADAGCAGVPTARGRLDSRPRRV
jgi:hypothetical protein